MIAQSYSIAPTLMAAEKLPDLSEGAIQQRAREAPRVQGARVAAEGLSELAYRDRTAIQATLDSIRAADNPAATARERARSIEADPEAIGALPGRAGTFWRKEDNERREAKGAVVDLAIAVEKYGDALAYERREIQRAHRDEQIRLATAIPAPSRELAVVLTQPVGKALEVLQKDQTLADELVKIVDAGRRRLSADDLREPGRVPDTYRHAAMLRDMHQQHVRQQTRGREIGPALTR
ncbi:BID domain-containing protein [Ancylobacter sp. FA202]|uniref:BID domain-containing protein n=1 Tax=Ancylobacter sp. FA202 TaxID=1111106 RepID=UPI0003672EE4|nr:BID domain-containing protein [Ancylobacter sp. FA202]